MSAKPPAIVAELGRPETPEETADRKARSRKAHFEHQTTKNLLLALAASAVLLLVMVLVVPRSDTPQQRPDIDVQAVAASAGATLDVPLVAPEVPATWHANVAELREGAGGVTTWYIAWITDDDRFLSLTQAIDANPTWTAQALENAPETGTIEIAGTTWSAHDRDDGGITPHQLLHDFDGTTVVLAGAASEAAFAHLATAASDTLQP